MSSWQKEFAGQMEALRSQSTGRFDRFNQDVLEPAYEQIRDFLSQWRFAVSEPACDDHQRLLRFALTENGYLLAMFRFEGIDALEFEYESYVPGAGRSQGPRVSTSLRSADQTWAERCLQSALSAFIARFAEAEQHARPPEPALV